MVDSCFLITVSNPLDRRRKSSSPVMLDSSGGRQPQRFKKPAKGTCFCRSPHGAAADAAVLVFVLFAFGFLLFPYLRLFWNGLAIAGSSVFVVIRDEQLTASMVWLFAIVSIIFVSLAGFALFFFAAGGRKCGHQNCRGQRNAAEFEVKIETEELMKSSEESQRQGRIIFELNELRHQDLKTELRKLAPLRGRAILLFQEKCGCPIGRLVVYGPKKHRKLHK